MGFLSNILCKVFGIGCPPSPPPVPPQPPVPPVNVVPFQAIEGRVVLDVQGLAKIPLSRNRDDFVLGVLYWETDGRPDASVPILGIHIRGTSQSDAGFILRWSPNLRHDQLVYAEHGEDEPELFVGGGHNFHNRVPVGDGLWTIMWDRDRIQVQSPKGVQVLTARIPGSIGFGRFSTELWDRRVNRYHLWKGFEAALHGTTAKLVSWAGKTGNLVRVE